MTASSHALCWTVFHKKSKHVLQALSSLRFNCLLFSLYHTTGAFFFSQKPDVFDFLRKFFDVFELRTLFGCDAPMRQRLLAIETVLTLRHTWRSLLRYGSLTGSTACCSNDIREMSLLTYSVGEAGRGLSLSLVKTETLLSCSSFASDSICKVDSPTSSPESLVLTVGQLS